MKINPVNNTNFSGKIIDAHAHIGTFVDKWSGIVDNFTAEDIIQISKRPINNGDILEKVIVSNLDGAIQEPAGLDNLLAQKGLRIKNLGEYDANMELYRICKENPILKPLAICQPENHSDTTEIRKVLTEGEFFGLKFHPEYTKVGAENSIYEPYMKLAKEFKLPCLFHCAQTPYSSPEQIYELAKRFPKVPVILAHLCAGGQHQRAVDVILESIKNNDATLYADISWVDCNSSDKRMIVSTLKQLENSAKGDMTSRLLFGTDAPLGVFGADGVKDVNYYSNNVMYIKDSIRRAFGDKADTIIEKLFYKNAQELFFGGEQSKETVKKSVTKNKYGKFIVGIILAIGGILVFSFNKKNNKTNV